MGQDVAQFQQSADQSMAEEQQMPADGSVNVDADVDADTDDTVPIPPQTANEKPAAWSQYTLKRRPWRPRVTDFDRIMAARYRGGGVPNDPYIVQWLNDDPCNPKTYSFVSKCVNTSILAVLNLCISLASSAYIGAAEGIKRDFHCSGEVFLLGLSFFVLGFGTGPLLFAPLSEALGRRNVLMVCMVLYIVWTGACIAAQNIQTMIVFRAFAGILGAAVTVIPSGVIADFFDAEQRGVAIALYASTPLLGPTLGPMIGGFIDMKTSWRWLFVVLTLFTVALTLVALLFVPETYAPVLLRDRAKLLSKVTGDTYMTKVDLENPVDFSSMVQKSLVLPWALSFREPIVLLLTVFGPFRIYKLVLLTWKSDLHLRNLWDLVPVFRCIPDCLPTRSRLERRRGWPGVHWNTSRHNHRLHDHHF